MRIQELPPEEEPQPKRPIGRPRKSEDQLKRPRAKPKPKPVEEPKPEPKPETKPEAKPETRPETPEVNEDNWTTNFLKNFGDAQRRYNTQRREKYQALFRNHYP